MGKRRTVITLSHPNQPAGRSFLWQAAIGGVEARSLMAVDGRI
jgi:hypothetical protein